MEQRIAHIALVVKDYDEAIKFYTEKIKLSLLEDTKLSEDKRWVLIAPTGAKECCLLFAKAANDKQMSSIGNQTGGRFFYFCLLMIFGETITKCLGIVSISLDHQKKKLTAWLQSLKTCMETFGIYYSRTIITKA